MFVGGNLTLDHVAQFFILPALYCVKEKAKATMFRKYSLGLKWQNESKLQNSNKRRVGIIIIIIIIIITILALQTVFPELIKLTECVFSKIVTELLAPPEE
jgi:hypothetical protein